MLRRDEVKDDTRCQALFAEQGCIRAAQDLHTISRLPGMAGEANDAVSAKTQAKMKDTPKLLPTERSTSGMKLLVSVVTKKRSEPKLRCLEESRSQMSKKHQESKKDAQHSKRFQLAKRCADRYRVLHWPWTLFLFQNLEWASCRWVVRGPNFETHVPENGSFFLSSGPFRGGGEVRRVSNKT